MYSNRDAKFTVPIPFLLFPSLLFQLVAVSNRKDFGSKPPGKAAAAVESLHWYSLRDRRDTYGMAPSSSREREEREEREGEIT